MSNPKFLSIGQAADVMPCRPRDISDLAYSRELDPSLFLAIGSRRVIPRESLPKIREVLAAKGKLKRELAAK